MPESEPIRYTTAARIAGNGTTLNSQFSALPLASALRNMAALHGLPAPWDEIVLRREGWCPPERDRRLIDTAPALYDACREAFEVIHAHILDEPGDAKRFDAVLGYLNAALTGVDGLDERDGGDDADDQD